jgi:hypothetical protein
MLNTFIKELLDCLAKELAIEENKQKLRTTLAAPLVEEMIPYIRISVSILLILGVLTFLNLGLTTYMFRHFRVKMQ